MNTINPGKAFEQEIKESVPQDCYYHRIKDTSQSFGSNTSYTRFSSHNECDLFLYRKPYLFGIELKSTSGTSFSYSLDDNKKMIKAFQIQSLRNMIQYGIVAGFILNFRDKAHTYWLGINQFDNIIISTDKKSINEKDVVSAGAILIPQTKKRTRYTYDLSAFMENKNVLEGE